MWATADLIDAVGCANMHLRCEATDVQYVLASYKDGGRDLSAAHKCIREKCMGGMRAAESAATALLPH